jgi:hypothetical protein
VLRFNMELLTRQAVIAMWDPTPEDLIVGGANDLCGDWKDRPCNTHIYLRVRPPERHLGRDNDEIVEGPWLDLTVCCRSNDILWGAYGANAVHFSFLHEYLAGRIGVEMGRMYQVSNNWHGYLAPIEKYREAAIALEGSGKTWAYDPYAADEVSAVSAGLDWSCWDEDLSTFLEWTKMEEPDSGPQEYPRNPWFHTVAEPMFVAHHIYKQGDKAHALEIAKDLVEAPDWSAAAAQWIQRRIK